MSQAQRGGQWNELGVFTFTGGQDYAITLSDDANGTVVADALYIVKVEDLTDAVTWAPSLPAWGSYQVYAKWTADETRATDAGYSIAHSGGTAAVSVNQRVGGGFWHYLGSYAFDPLSNPTVTLAANDNGSVAADAIRFVGGPGGATDVAFLHTDHLGTPQVMTDASAQVLWWRDQTPFGQTVTTGGFSQNPLRFPGQIADAESDLAYNYFRDYDPALGRYIQSDPIGLRGGLNTYGYVGGNPLRWLDRLGLEGTIAIHSTGDGGSSMQSGHSWISYTPDGGSTTTYGTWGNDPTGKGNGLFRNLERGRRGDASRTMHLNDEQEEALFDLIARYERIGEEAWKLSGPCSAFASDAWETSTGEHLDATWGPISNPTTLKESIIEANGGVNHMNATEPAANRSWQGVGSSSGSSGSSLNSADSLR